MKTFSIILSVPEGSKMDNIVTIVRRGLQFGFFLLKFKKVSITVEKVEFDGDTSTEETLLKVEY